MKRKQPDSKVKAYDPVKRLMALKKARIEREEIALARHMYDPTFVYNPPIPSGAPSGLYNISSNSKEYKFVDTTLGTSNSPTLVGTAPGTNFMLLNGLKLGTSAFSRIGNKITMKSLYWSLAFALSSSDADPGTDTNINNVPVRMMIVYDKQTNGALPGLSDLVTNVTGVDNNTARAIDVNSPNNLNNKDRFIVLADKRFVLQTGGPSSRYIKKYKKLSTAVAYKSGATVGDVSDITSGGLYFIAYRDADIGGVTDPVSTINLTGDIRLRYLDD